ncbi:MAG: TfoX/Sxy family protein [Acidimicrobiia bacterium]|nr:TfoX/Sxy family protein [Acidimicrobiia bacterium]
MAYDAKLAEKIRRLMVRRPGTSERKMFGGLAFMVKDHMCCGVLDEKLVVWVAPNDAHKWLAPPDVRPMDFTGQPMRGFLYVEKKAYAAPGALARWVGRAVAFAESLPPKRPKRAPRSRPARR